VQIVLSNVWELKAPSKESYITKLDSLHWFSQRRSPTPHFRGAHPGGYDPQIRTRPRFLYNAPAPPPSFIILCLLVRKLSGWQTNTRAHPHTNKQTDKRRWKHPTFFATLWRWVKSNSLQVASSACGEACANFVGKME